SYIYVYSEVCKRMGDHMMKRKVLIVNRLDQQVIDKLATKYQLSFIETTENTKNALFEAVKDVEGIIGYGFDIDEPLLQYAKKLKIACNISVGFNNFDVNAMKK